MVNRIEERSETVPKEVSCELCYRRWTLDRRKRKGLLVSFNGRASLAQSWSWHRYLCSWSLLGDVDTDLRERRKQEWSIIGER